MWVLIAAGEVVNGVLRMRLLNRRAGDKRARQIAVFAIGALWVVLMFGLEAYFGRVVFRVPWKRILADFDFRRGGFLALGFAVLFFAPWISAKLHGAF